MNSNTLLRIFGCFVISACVFSVRYTDAAGPPAVRGAFKTIPTRSVAPLASGAIPLGRSADVALPLADVLEDEEAVVADDPAITTAELAKQASMAQAVEADTQEKAATEANKVSKSKSEEATAGIEDVRAALALALEASKDAAAAKTSAEAYIKAEETSDATKVATDKAAIVEDAAKEAQSESLKAETAAKASKAAATFAKARAANADKLDSEPSKPIAKVAKDKADLAEKSALAAKESAESAAKFASSANDVKIIAEGLVKEAEKHKADALASVEAKEAQEKPVVELPPAKEVTPESPVTGTTPGSPNTPSKPSGTDTTENGKLPDKAKTAEMNYVKEEKYNYQAQLLKEDRCSAKIEKETKCKKFSNCYLDHTKPICVCFPGYTSTDATKTDCKKVDKPTCKNEANTCHRNANCKESKTLGIGCQCKEKFSGDGLLCSSAFSYFMNFFLVLAVVSVQLYM